MNRTIPAIDKDIDATVKLLRQRRPVPNLLSAADWQRAWDAEPDLSAQHRALYRERGLAQVERDERAYQDMMVTARQRQALPKVRPCLTCKGTGKRNAAAAAKACSGSRSRSLSSPPR